MSALSNASRLLIAGALCVATAACNLAMPGSTPAPTTLVAGSPAPGLTFLDLQDAPHTLTEFHGKPVMLVMFAYWCPHCQDDMPKIQQYATAHPKLAFVPVEASGGAKDVVSNFKGRYGVTDNVYYDPEKRAATALQISAYPTCLLIGPDGTVVDRTIGPPPYDTYDRLLNSFTP